MAKNNLLLYFVSGFAPSKEDIEYTSKFEGVNLSYRNAGYVFPDTPLEECDAVGGPAVPKQYAEKYPSIEDYYAELVEKREVVAKQAEQVAGKKARKPKKEAAAKVETAEPVVDEKVDGEDEKDDDHNSNDTGWQS